MQTALTGFLIFLFASLSAGQSFYGTSDVKVFRQGRDAEFRKRPESPLLDVDFAKFAG
jgi:hypothetical protein